VITKNLKEFKISNKGIFSEKYLDKELLELSDCACTEIVKRLSPSKLWKKKLFNNSKYMFSFFKMSFQY
jgi:chromosome condensin MukBEF MukE localization factor